MDESTDAAMARTKTDELMAELKRESATTRRVLERVPEDQLSWKPHAKSMSLGELALHIAQLPRGIAELLGELSVEVPAVPLREATSREELLSAFDQAVAVAATTIAEWGEDGLAAEWRLTRDEHTLFALPRAAVVRTLMLNHSYHHRGQLTVYLRLLGVPVPAVYGPTADENPFA